MRGFIKLVNGEFSHFVNSKLLGITEQELNEATPEQLASMDCAEVFVQPCEAYDDAIEICRLSSPKLANGVWIQTWDIRPKTEAELKMTVASVTMAQAKIALYRKNKLAEVEELIEQAGGELKLWWDAQVYMYRDSPLVSSVAQQLGWSEQFVNELFQLATTI